MRSKSTNMRCITNSEDEMVRFKGNAAFYANAIILTQCYKEGSMAAIQPSSFSPLQLHNDVQNFIASLKKVLRKHCPLPFYTILNSYSP